MSKLQYAVFHMDKYNTVARLGTHIDRKNYDQNKERVSDGLDNFNKEYKGILDGHIDPTRTHLNEELAPFKRGRLSKDVEKRIAAGYTGKKAIRKDAIKAIGIIMTGSNLRMKEIENNVQLFEQWKRENHEFVCQEFGKENVVRCTLHMDEKTPHIHAIVIPLHKDGSLSANRFMDGRSAMRAYQDRYAEAMQKFGLERGMHVNLSGKSYDDMKTFKKNSLERNKVIEKETVKSIPAPNLLNFKKIHQELARELVNKNREIDRLKRANEEKEFTYSQVMKERISNDLERVKREVNLVQHAISMGYKTNKSKSSQYWSIMEKDGDRVSIKNSPNEKGQWVYSTFGGDNKDKGTIVDFMKNRGFSYQDIRGLSSVHLDNTVIKEQKELSLELKDPVLSKQLAQEHFNESKERNTSNYLTARGIETATYAPYQGENLMVADKAVFALYNSLDSQGSGEMCSTITYNYRWKQGGVNMHREKHLQKGLSRGLSVLKDPDVPVERIVITESPIDALSYKQIHKEPNSTMYLATCGSITNDMKGELSRVFAGAKENGQEIVLAFDNDIAGKKMEKIVKGLSKEMSLEPKIVVPQLEKDWNQELTASMDTQVLFAIAQLQRDMAQLSKSQRDMDEEDDRRKKRREQGMGMER